MTRWEYRAFSIRTSHWHQSFENHLNHEGDEGWELVGVIPGWFIIFKRPAQTLLGPDPTKPEWRG